MKEMMEEYRKMNTERFPRKAEDYLIDNGTKCHEQIKSDLQTLLDDHHEIAALKERLSNGIRVHAYGQGKHINSYIPDPTIPEPEKPNALLLIDLPCV